MASDVFKVSSGSRAWDLGANWSTGAVPQAVDDAFIYQPSGVISSVTIAATDPAYTVRTLTLNSQSNSTPETLAISGKLTVLSGEAIMNSSMIGDYGSLTLAGPLALSGFINVTASGVLASSIITGSGIANVYVSGGAASVEIALGSTDYTLTGGSLAIGQTSGMNYFGLNGGALSFALAGTSLADTIAVTKATSVDLRTVAYQAGETVTLTQNMVVNVVPIYTATVKSAQGQTLFTFNNIENGSFPSAGPPVVTTASDGAGGTLVTVACYTPGTLIQTPGGERAAGSLAIGDLVTTVDGRSEPVRWVGRRSYAGRFLARQAHLLPVCIGAGALGGGLPRRDLMVSPCHAMLLDGVLVPASSLVNGVTITQAVAADRVDYVHIELARHDVILAEGAASETFLDEDSRGSFHNAAEFAALYPAAGDDASVPCAPRVADGYVLEAIRARLLAVAEGARAA